MLVYFRSTLTVYTKQKTCSTLLNVWFFSRLSHYLYLKRHRAPKKGGIFTSVACGADDEGLPSIGRVLGILYVRERTYILIRWFSPTFLNSNRAIPRRKVLAQQYKRLVLTNSCAVVQIDQLVSVCHVVPEFVSFHDENVENLYFVNNLPLGTTLRNKAKENLYAIQERHQESIVNPNDSLLQKTFEVEERGRVSSKSLTSLSFTP